MEPSSVSQMKTATAAYVDAWLHELQHGRRLVDPSKSFCNDEQFQAIDKIAHRVTQELLHEADPKHHSFMDPLRWLVHGGPGTGKTKYVIKIIKKEFSRRRTP